MENEKIDFPRPPHHYLCFETPESLSPPAIRKLASHNPEFYPLGGREPFADEAEKIFPYYLADKRVLYKYR
jgi:hypothetical protein